MTVPNGAVLLGTIALEPNRWGSVDRSGRATVVLSEWTAAIAEAGFDGLELWDRHVTQAPPDEVAAVVNGPLPVTVFNTYVSFDDADPTRRDAVAAWVTETGSRGVKFNVGNDPGKRELYAERVTSWLEKMPAGVALLCECHAGISIAEDPAVAAKLFGAAGPAERVQAIVHTHEDPDHIRSRFDAYGERITHVHVNFLDATHRAPGLGDVRAHLAAKVELLGGLGFRGSWTIEFVHGLLTERDQPEALVPQAVEDLAVLRDVLS